MCSLLCKTDQGKIREFEEKLSREPHHQHQHHHCQPLAQPGSRTHPVATTTTFQPTLTTTTSTSTASTPYGNISIFLAFTVMYGDDLTQN